MAKLTFEEFQAKAKEIDERSQALFNEKVELVNKYVDDNAEFKVGDKVLCNGVPAFVYHRQLSYDTVIYDLRNMKKDGTMGRNHVWYTDKSVIKKFEG
jgi:hypothetical protein